jgi:anti-repressor protein
VVKHHLTDSLGRNQEASFITEGDLYRLIMKSKLPSAEKFESWVMDEVLPTIRKTGSYKPMTIAEQIQLLVFRIC